MFWLAFPVHFYNPQIHRQHASVHMGPKSFFLEGNRGCSQSHRDSILVSIAQHSIHGHHWFRVHTSLRQFGQLRQSPTDWPCLKATAAPAASFSFYTSFRSSSLHSGLYRLPHASISNRRH